MPSALLSASFWIDCGERAVRSFSTGVLTSSGLGALKEFDKVLGVVMPSITWQVSLMFGALQAVGAVLTSLSSLKVPGADHETGSFLPPAPEPAIKLHSLFSRDHHI